jgi:hypothetical protein
MIHQINAWIPLWGAICATSLSLAQFPAQGPTTALPISYPGGSAVVRYTAIAATVLAQSEQQPFGTHCASSGGVCDTLPAPIGYPCQCGPYPGTVVP